MTKVCGRLDQMELTVVTRDDLLASVPPSQWATENSLDAARPPPHHDSSRSPAPRDFDDLLADPFAPKKYDFRKRLSPPSSGSDKPSPKCDPSQDSDSARSRSLTEKQHCQKPTGHSLGVKEKSLAAIWHDFSDRALASDPP